MINRLNQIITKRLSEHNLTNEDIASEFKMSTSSLTRKVKTMTGQSPTQYIRSYRLECAKQFISEGTFVTVNELSNAVGFSDAHYFSHKFKEYFDKTPLQMLRDYGWR